MAAAKYNILIEQGATFQLNLLWKDSAGTPIDLSGYTARMQVRRKVDSPTTLLSLTTENGGIALGGITGTIAVVAQATATDDISEKIGVYDLELVDGSGVVTRLVEGCVTISPEVTR
jgi:hypothetical protein